MAEEGSNPLISEHADSRMALLLGTVPSRDELATAGAAGEEDEDEDGDPTFWATETVRKWLVKNGLHELYSEC